MKCNNKILAQNSLEDLIPTLVTQSSDESEQEYYRYSFSYKKNQADSNKISIKHKVKKKDIKYTPQYIIDLKKCLSKSRFKEILSKGGNKLKDLLKVYQMEYFVCDIYNRKVENKQILLNRKSKLLNVIENPTLLDYDCQFDNNMMKNFCSGFASFYCKNESEIYQIAEKKLAGKHIRFIENRFIQNKNVFITNTEQNIHGPSVKCNNVTFSDNIIRGAITFCDNKSQESHNYNAIDESKTILLCQKTKLDLDQVPKNQPKLITGTDSDRLLCKSISNIFTDYSKGKFQECQHAIETEGSLEIHNANCNLSIAQSDTFKSQVPYNLVSTHQNSTCDHVSPKNHDTFKKRDIQGNEIWLKKRSNFKMNDDEDLYE